MRDRKRIVKEKTEVPLSSMIDVVFLLLIYFIVVQKPIIETTLLKSDLPSGSRSPQKIESPEILKIDVVRQPQKDGHDYYRMFNKWWQADLLFAQLEKKAENNKEMTVIINCGPNAKHHKLVSLLDACAKAELENLNIVNDESIQFSEIK